MALGITPKYSEEILLELYTPGQFLCLALEAVKSLQWNIGSVSPYGFTAYTKMSWSSWSEEVKVIISHDKALIKSECTGSQLADWGKNKRNVQNFITALSVLKKTLRTEELDDSFVKLKFSSADENEELVSDLPVSPKDRVTGFFPVFKPIQGYFITPILINLNIVIFIAMCLSGASILNPDAETILNWGGNFRPLTLDGQWWRLLTSCFLHFGIFHLLMNMYALMYIGLLLEPLLGRTKFLLAYLLTGITGSLMSLSWHDYTVSAGASGAIFGMYGVFLAMLTTNLIEKSSRKALLSSIVIFVVYNLANGLKGNTDNAAHIGGLLGGLCIGYCYYPILKDRSSIQLRNTVMSAVTILVLALAAIVYVSINNDLAIFNKNIEAFSENEKIALEVYNIPDSTDKKIILKKIRQGLRMWQNNIGIIKKNMALNVPEYYRIRNKLLQDYCYSRFNTYNFMSRAIQENTDKYTQTIEQFNAETQSIIEKISSINK